MTDLEEKQKKRCAFCAINNYIKANPSARKKDGLITIPNYGYESCSPAENEKCQVLADRIPRTKGHLMIIPKEHRETIRDLTIDEWNYIFPLLKDMVNKIAKVLRPAGVLIYTYNQSWEKDYKGYKFQSVPHVHFHILPVYKKKYGFNWNATRLKRAEPQPGQTESLVPTFAEYQESIDKLEPDDKGIISQRTKAMTQLVPREQALIQGHIVIKPKIPIPNDINAIDAETWNQMGELLFEAINETADKLNCKAFIPHLPLGKLTGPTQNDFSEFQIHLLPYKEEKLAYYIPGTSNRDYVRIARKIMDPDNPEHRLSNKIAEREREREREREHLKATPYLSSLC